MTWASPKSSLAMNAYPKTFARITVLVGALALFLIFGSWVLVSNPVVSTVHGYFYGMDRSGKLDLSFSSVNITTVDTHVDVVDKNVSSDSSFEVNSVDKILGSNSSLQVPTISSGPLSVSETKEMKDQEAVVPLSSAFSSFDDSSKIIDRNLTRDSNSQVAMNSADPSTISDTKKAKDLVVSVPVQSSSVRHHRINIGAMPASSPYFPLASDANKTGPAYSGCDLYHGSWIHDSSGPLYTNNTCPVLTQMQNCQGNGRPDKDYENWRWKPFQCDLPRFDGRKFLELMRGKTIAFVGDSVARNQMESLLCILWQVEVPKNRGNRNMQRYFFKSTSVMVVRIWSSWLVKQTSEPFDFAPEGIAKLHLDAPDDHLMEYIPKFDVVVLSSGHWFTKQSVYILNNEIVGGQLWWPDKSRPVKINSVEAFGISVETILSAFDTHPNFTGITIVRTYSPDHYEGGAWNSGGSCTGKVKPLVAGELVENGFTKIMHEKQVTGFYNAIKKATNKSKMTLMDITEAFEYRHDGHPGPYRNQDPHKLTKRGPDGRPPPQDCLHWCMPGPVDTWNELVLEILRREYEGNTSVS